MGLKMIVKNASDAFMYHDQITNQGLQRDRDYTWRFTPAVNTWLGDDVITPATVEFDFKDDQWATYFQLRWAK